MRPSLRALVATRGTIVGNKYLNALRPIFAQQDFDFDNLVAFLCGFDKLTQLFGMAESVIYVIETVFRFISDPRYPSSVG